MTSKLTDRQKAEILERTVAVLRDAVAFALHMLPPKMTSDPALVMLAAIGIQESKMRDRRQMPKGPARGLWQFERGGGVLGVLAHHSTYNQARTVCEACGVNPTSLSVYRRLEHDDVLAAAFARLLVWTDPKPLPAIGDERGAWDLYDVRLWRPGKSRPDDWPDSYAIAVEAVQQFNALPAASAGENGDR